MVGWLDELRKELMRRLLVVTAAAFIVVACRDGQAADDRGHVGNVVDSIRPPAEATARFLRALPVVSSLAGGAATAEALLSQIADAVSRADTADLERIIVTQAEYGRLYYPSSVFTRKPYELSPDIAWLLNSESNVKGRRRLLERLGGKQVRFARLTCAEPMNEGENTIRKDCTVEVSVARREAVRLKVFHSLIERGGHVKILSLAGDY